MRREIVPDNMSGEIKNILGIISSRQVIYLLAGGFLIYWYIPKVYLLHSDAMVSIVLSMFSVVPTAVIVFYLGFVKNKKQDMFYDHYLKILLFKKTQVGNWRK